MPARIFIVEDHPRMRDTYTLFIARVPDIEICGMVATGAEALAQIPDADPDIVLVDLSLPDIDGVELVRRLRRQFPSLPILIVSGYQASQYTEHIASLGADGFLNKEHAYDTLLPRIREILSEAAPSTPSPPAP